MEYRLSSIEQLPTYLKHFRKKHSLTQKEMGIKVNLSQRSYSALETNPSSASFERVYNVLHALEIHTVFVENSSETQNECEW